MSGYNGMQLPETMPEYMLIKKSDILALAELLAGRDNGKRLTLKEAAEAYNISVKTLQRRIASGVIKGIKSGGLWEIETPSQRAARLNIN